MDNKLSTSISVAINSVNKSTRESILQLGNDPLFTPVYDISIRKQKDLSFERLKKLCSHKGLFSVKNFRTDPENIFTMHEMLSYIDASLATKFTVQFNLFGGTIIGLGSQKHEKFLDLIDELKVVGCFCLTEVGYGNNAIEMETTATYIPETKSFKINCPTIKSQKFWITNGAYHANYAAVFAQTYINNKHEGINTFLLKIREDDGSLCKGVIIDDMGHKMGSNGVDNARIIFKDVETAEENMLDKVSKINDGKFVSTIKGNRARFIYAANRLLSGRLCIASMMISCSRLVIATTIRYSKLRLSNGKSGKSDTPIFDYQLTKNQLIPLLVRTLIYNIALLDIRKLYSHYILNESSYDDAKINNIIRLCCFIKPMISWHTNIVGNVCRERCGGQGYLSINIVELAVAGAHSGITAEGDSSVLMQKVAKEYVEDYVKQVIQLPISDVDEARNKKYNPFKMTDLLNLIKIRETLITQSLAEKTASNVKEIYETWMLKEADLIQDVAFTYGKRFCIESFLNSDLYKVNSISR